MKRGALRERILQQDQAGQAQQRTATWQGSPVMVPATPSLVRVSAKFKNTEHLKLIIATYPLLGVASLLSEWQPPTLPG